MPDGSPHTLIPKNTQIEIEEICDDWYEITAQEPITKNNDKAITVSKRELDQFI